LNPVTDSWLNVIRSINAKLGNIVALARNNTWAIIDRDKRMIKYKVRHNFEAYSTHDIVPSI